MIYLLQIFVFGHVHRWKTEDWVHLSNSDGSTGRRYFQQCEKCGIAHKVDCI